MAGQEAIDYYPQGPRSRTRFGGYRRPPRCGDTPLPSLVSLFVVYVLAYFGAPVAIRFNREGHGRHVLTTYNRSCTSLFLFFFLWLRIYLLGLMEQLWQYGIVHWTRLL